MPYRSYPLTEHDEVIEHLRQGTREQYESDWTYIPAGLSRQFDHDLGEIPVNCNVSISVESGGPSPKNAVVEATTDRALTITRVRTEAMNAG